MGLWVEFEGYLEFNKPMNPDLRKKINDYIENESWMDPHQPYGTKCPWYIDEKNRLIPVPVKFYDHEVWLQYLIREFFKPDGYDISGLLLYSFEGSRAEKEIYLWDSWFFTKQFTVDKSVSYEEIKSLYEVLSEKSISLKELKKMLLSLFAREPDLIMDVLKEHKLIEPE